MTDIALESALNRFVTFAKRPIPLGCDLRPEWRMHVLVLLVEQCWGGRAGLQQLHVLNWAIRTEETREAFIQFIRDERAPSQIIVRYDPSLNRAVEFAFAEGLLTNREEESNLFAESEKKADTHYRIGLAKKGRDLAEKLRNEKAVLVTEKHFLASIGRKFTQKQVESLFDWGTAK